MKYEDSASLYIVLPRERENTILPFLLPLQDVQDFLSTDYGKAVLSNSSYSNAF